MKKMNKTLKQIREELKTSWIDGEYAFAIFAILDYLIEKEAEKDE